MQKLNVINKKVNIILSGCNGKMGKVITNLVSTRSDCKISAGIDLVHSSTEVSFPVFKKPSLINCNADVIIDFSNPCLLNSLLCYSINNCKPLVLCTTGYSNSQIEQIQQASAHIPIFYSRNMSLGINLLIELSKKAAIVFGENFDIEIVEKHHNQKIDSPSGTALMIADEISNTLNNKPVYVYDRHSYRQKRQNNEIGIHSVRAGTIVGEHEVIFAGHDEVLTITHSALSKEIFASGAINASFFIINQKPGLYDMSDMLS